MDCNNKFYGSCFVRDINDRPVAALFRKYRQDSNGVRKIVLYIVEKGSFNKIGEVSYTKIGPGLNSGKYGAKNFKLLEVHKRYALVKDTRARIFIIEIENVRRGQYKQVGTALIKKVMEVSLKDKNGSRGRIQLEAVGDSHPFYYRLGFKAMTGRDILRGSDYKHLEPEEIDRLFQKYAKDKHSIYVFGSVFMYLPERARL